MTLVEILIALAIASLMTLTGWRAIDALQSSRDRVQRTPRNGNNSMTFCDPEADLRRASLSDSAAARRHVVAATGSRWLAPQ